MRFIPTTRTSVRLHCGLASASALLLAAASPAQGARAPTTVTRPPITQPPAPVTVQTPTSAGAPLTTPSAALGLSACAPSGRGTDYRVGTGQPYTSLDAVPWESLRAGDTVRIFYRDAPYRSKFLIAGQGTADAPIRVCGVRGPNGERPVIDGSGATTRAALGPLYNGTLAYSHVHQDRAIIVLKPLATEAWTAYPRYIQIDGLKITRGHPDYRYRTAAGAERPYAPFGACIWVDRGQHITIADNEITDCQMAVFSKSTDDGDFAVTRDLRIAGNRFAGHGIVGDWHEHTTYLQSVGTVVEFNDYGPLRSGAPGNAIKDRSVGAVIRYNRIEEGAHAIDLVEAEDFPVTARALPAYRSTQVYGNQIIKTGDTGSVIHYGGDHFGSAPGAGWGEPLFRQGTLHFWNNTVLLKGTQAWVFQISTTLEKVEAWNNVFYFAPSVAQRNLRMHQEVAAPWVGGGVLNLGVNWISTGWQDSDPWHPVGGTLSGTQWLQTGTGMPVDATTMQPMRAGALTGRASAR
ncbi:hypothetical protein [uncultured Sphaerotilus sp.]|uniref:hypothetical protein n=1 Tax=uncultured Sphaerotilus sp. TaxID=474984 RepID=UPI0030CA4750